MALTSPRDGFPQTPLDVATSVPLAWTDSIEHRRKLAEAIQGVAAYVKAIPAYAGIWRTVQATPETINTTTSWQPVTGHTENRPSKQKRAEADYTNNEVTVLETGIYNVFVTYTYQGKQNRFYDFGARLNGVDPTETTIRQECLTNNGYMLLNYTTVLTITEVPSTFIIVVKSETNTTMDFLLGGWSVQRVDFNTPGLPNQRIFT